MLSFKKIYNATLFYLKRYPKVAIFSLVLSISIILVTVILLPLKYNLDLKKDRYSAMLLSLPQEKIPTAAKVDYDDVLKQEIELLERLRANFFSVNDATLFLVSILDKWCDDLSITIKKMAQRDSVLFLKDDALIPVELHLEGKYNNLNTFLQDLETFENDIFLSKLDVVRTDDKQTLLYMIIHFHLPVRGD